jgi:hypothetical protein
LGYTLGLDHPRVFTPVFFFDEIERPVNVFLLRIQTASKRQLVCRVVDPMRDNGSPWQTGTNAGDFSQL